MLEARHLSRIYPAQVPVTAVADVSLSVVAGEFLAVVGHSGSGKSTLLGMLGAQSRPSGGLVLVDGADIWQFAPDALAEYRCRQIGFVFQFASLLPSLRAIDNVALPALLGATGDLDAAYHRARELLVDVGLGDRLLAYPGELSGGQQRKVALARALINQPRLILADEPTGDLDEASEREVLRLLLQLHRRHSTTLIVVTHRMVIAEQADRVIHLEAGRVVSTTTPSRTATPCPEVEAKRPEPVASMAPPEEVLGSGGRRWLTGFVGWMALAVLLVWALNFGTSVFQRRAIQQHQAEKRSLELAAMQQVRAEVQDITYLPNNTYRLTLYVQNLAPANDLYLLAPSARVFVQVDRSWIEIATTPQQENTVVPRTGRREFVFDFRPELPRFEEQLAGYMHIRVVNAMLISRSREPKGDLFERTDDYYVYLKPQNADDAEIARRNKWNPSVRPPRWIPMPPH
jgi:putative ABC transport system ATP-binding protein/macrolide transport system ATP-binding/permease protein/lipoprotein-releasing system ATP-binding protein